MSVMSPSVPHSHSHAQHVDPTFRPTLLSDYFFNTDEDDEMDGGDSSISHLSMSQSQNGMDSDTSPQSRIEGLGLGSGSGSGGESTGSTPTIMSPHRMTPIPQSYASPVKTVTTPAGDTEEWVGPFKLGAVLGVGCTGTVRHGVHKDTQFEAAFKIIEKKYLNTDPKLWKKVKREIVILKVIEHPHVLKLYDVLETVNRLYLVLEHVRGGELFDYIVSRGRLDRHEALKLTAQIVQGLEHCHAHSICHRDLKPENLLLDENHNIKIADFGMAQLMKRDNMRKTSCGSPHYASPEVIEGGSYDAKLADIWSIGVILYALLTGSLPFDHDSIPILLAMVSRGQYTIPPQVPADCADLIRRMLVVDPTKRITLSQIRHHPCYRNTDFFPPETPHTNTNPVLGTASTPSPPGSSNSSPCTSANSTPQSLTTQRRSLKLDTNEVDERVLLDLESLGLGWGTSDGTRRDELRRKISLFAKRRSGSSTDGITASASGSGSGECEEEPPIEHVFYQRLLQRRMDRLAELSRLSPKPRPRTIGARASSSLSISSSAINAHNSMTLPPAAAAGSTPPMLMRSFTDGSSIMPSHPEHEITPLSSPASSSQTSAQNQAQAPSQPPAAAGSSSQGPPPARKPHLVPGQASSAPARPSASIHQPSPLALPVPPPYIPGHSPLQSPSSGATPPFHQLLSPMHSPLSSTLISPYTSPPLSPSTNKAAAAAAAAGSGSGSAAQSPYFSELPSPAAGAFALPAINDHAAASSASSAPSSCKQSSRRLFAQGQVAPVSADTTTLVTRAIQNKRISIPSANGVSPLQIPPSAPSPRVDLVNKGLTNVMVPSPTAAAAATAAATAARGTPSYMESPRFHRKKLRQQPETDQSAVKKSWFSAIFSARPSMNIMSTLTGRKPSTPRSQTAAAAATATATTTGANSSGAISPPSNHTTLLPVTGSRPPHMITTHPSPPSLAPMTMPMPSPTRHDPVSTLYSDKSISSLVDELRRVLSELHLSYVMKRGNVFEVEDMITHSQQSTPIDSPSQSTTSIASGSKSASIPSSQTSSANMSTVTTPIASTRPRLSSTDLTIAIHEESDADADAADAPPSIPSPHRSPQRRRSGADVSTSHSPTSHAVNALAGGIDAIRISLGEPALAHALSPHARLTIQVCEPSSTSPASIQFVQRTGEPQAVRALQSAIQKALMI